MKALTAKILVFVWALLTCELALAQTSVAVNEPMVRGRVVLVNPGAKGMTIVVEPAGSLMTFYGLERARIEKARGQLGAISELHPGMTVAVYYASRAGHRYPLRVLMPDTNLAVPASPLTSGESKALDSKAANDGDITTNPGVKARIDKDITTQPGEKDPTDRDITKQGK